MKTLIKKAPVQANNVVHVGPCSLYLGDCLEVLKTLPDNSVDSIVTDPPAGINFMGKEWDQAKLGRDKWIDWLEERMKEALRVLKPGGHALVWALPRTSHWTATACEDAGFEIRDRVSHLFGTGFPKNMDVSKAIDKAAGAVREVVGSRPLTGKARVLKGGNYDGGYEGKEIKATYSITAPATLEAAQWEGWGTALKPACEDWWLCRKPLEGTVAANVLKYGTGALNIDGCRVGEPIISSGGNNFDSFRSREGRRDRPPTHGTSTTKEVSGRFPAHLIHDGSDEVLEGFPNSKSTSGRASLGAFRNGNVYGKGRDEAESRDPGYGDDGSASRFFYCTKASKKDRNEGEVTNKHPTVKNTELMRYLCRLITPPGGTVLDMFSGSFSTGKAAVREGFRFIGIEADKEYFNVGVQRIKHEVNKLGNE